MKVQATYNLGNWVIEPGKNAIRSVDFPEQLLRPKIMLPTLKPFPKRVIDY